MARKPMVTRTIVTTQVVIMALDIEKGEPFNETMTLPRTYSDDKKLLKVVQDSFNTDTIKAVHIVSKEEVETLYGMAESDFIKYAQVLDPETRKALDTADATDTAEEE